jgi:predicted RNA-binding protein YlqC (UPF0109 family)
VADADNTEKLVRYLITALVDNPDDVTVEAKQYGDSTTFEVTLNPDDVGKVIGRQGRIIKAIRTLARAAGSSETARVDVEVVG